MPHPSARYALEYGVLRANGRERRHTNGARYHQKVSSMISPGERALGWSSTREASRTFDMAASYPRARYGKEGRTWRGRRCTGIAFHSARPFATGRPDNTYSFRRESDADIS